MGKRRPPYQKKPFESSGASNDVSANLYASMLMSPAWMDLTAQQKTLYVMCKLQLYGEKQKPTDDPASFTMNQAKWCKLYKLYKPGNGFVICVSSGAFGKTKSIYRLSSMWQKWGTAAFEVSLSEMTLARVRKRRDKKE